jgi:protein-S-isoprenylcysteine O-methyltransferase Ste14
MAVMTTAAAAGSIDEVAYRRASRERLAELGARAGISTLFVVLAVSIGAEFLKTGHLTGLLLLVSELLVVVLTVVRRPAVAMDRSIAARVVTTASIMSVPFIRPNGIPVLPDAVTAGISAAGLLVIIVGKMTLGRSFGLIPANRGIVCRGVYRVVRHPIYSGYLVTHVGFVLAHPTSWNLALLVIGDVALLLRALREEQTLSLDAEYADYLTRVRWRVAPWVF